MRTRIQKYSWNPLQLPIEDSNLLQPLKIKTKTGNEIKIKSETESETKSETDVAKSPL
jgi:hypothetical protein